MITRSLTNGSKLVDWTEEVNELDNQYGLINSMGLFSENGISQLSVVFDKNIVEHTLMSQSDRQGNRPTSIQGRKLETFSLATSYFNEVGQVTANDVQGIRDANTPDGARNIASAVTEKMIDMRVKMDQTKEYMKIQAIKGVTKDADGNILANMFDEFSISQKEVDFDLGTETTDVDAKIAEVKRYIAKNAKAGGAIGKIEILCDPEFFDKLVSHPSMRTAYQYYQNSTVQLLRDDLSTYETWGVTDTFEHRGVRFTAYDATFTLPSGSTEDAFDASTGFSIVKGMRGLYRGYNSPANTLSGANQVGSPLFAYETRDPSDKFINVEIEAAPLHVLMKPQVSVKVISST